MHQEPLTYQEPLTHQEHLTHQSTRRTRAPDAPAPVHPRT